MAPSTPRQPSVAGAFITLSLPKNASSRLSQNTTGMATPAEVEATSPTQPKRRDVRKCVSQVVDDNGTSQAMPQKRPATPPPALSTQPSPIKSKIITLKYRTAATIKPSTPNNDLNGRPSAVVDAIAQIGSMHQTDRTENEAQMQRRASTASLTDGGTRSSGRNRKLTTKAQALAGTKLLPSLQNLSNTEAVPVPMTRESSIEQTAELEDQRAVIESINASPQSIETDAPVESVETPSVRSSRRERKPTVRAIESETTRVTRKRPASPATSERAVKMAKKSPSASTKPSKLRHSIMDVEMSAETTSTLEALPVSQATEISEPAAEPLDVVSQGTVLTSQETSTSQATIGDMDTSQSLAESSTKESLEEQPRPQEPQTSEISPTCSLDCLSPSSRLLAFAKLAAEWIDTDEVDDEDDDDDDIDLGILDTEPSVENQTLLRKAYETSCRCPHVVKVTQISQSRDSIPQHSSASSGEISASNLVKICPNQNPVDIRKSTKLSQKSTRSKTHRSSPLVQPPITVQQNIELQRPTIQRQGSTFEQRMQADYLAAQRARSASAQAYSLHTGQSQTATPHIAKYPAASPPIRFQAIADLGTMNGTNAQNGFTPHNMQTSTVFSPPLLAHDMYGTKSRNSNPLNNGPNTSHAQKSNVHNSLSSKPITKTSENVVTGKPLKPSNKVGMRGGGRSSGGSVRLSLQDNPGHEKDSVMKQYQTLAPPQARSIKLKFTTAAK